MGFKVDIFQIPNGIYASKVDFSHYLKSQQYDENVRSLIRKYASKLSDFYFIRLDCEYVAFRNWIRKDFPDDSATFAI